ncbi:MAG: right-handed parallel beta-helix repeat-containing protein [Nanoarchaeota archaeon]|nr:right-handed parallel beta-helix repeat-containing protein [Nanoarchaeota archaeon]
MKKVLSFFVIVSILLLSSCDYSSRKNIAGEKAIIHVSEEQVPVAEIRPKNIYTGYKSLEPQIHEYHLSHDARGKIDSISYQEFRNKYDSTMLFDSINDYPARIYGIKYAISLASLVQEGVSEAILDFISDNSDIFITSPNMLRAVKEDETGNFWRLKFEQVHNGLPVHNGKVIVIVDKEGNIDYLGQDIFMDVSSSSTSPTLNDNEIERIINEDNPDIQDAEIEIHSLKIMPILTVDDYEFTLVQEVIFTTKDIGLAYYIGVGDDRYKGEILAKDHTLRQAEIPGRITGMILPRHFYDDPVEEPFPSENLWLDSISGTTDINGNFDVTVPENQPYTLTTHLTSPYAVVLRDDGQDNIRFTGIATPDEPNNILWEDPSYDPFTGEGTHQDEINSFYHFQMARKYTNEVLDYSIDDDPYRIYVGYNSYQGSVDHNNKIIRIGNGKDIRYNLGLYGDTLYHEYAHAVTHDIYGGGPSGLPYYGESGALDEALADYFTCTITGEPYFLNGIWKDGRDNNYLRILDNDMTYPDDMRYNVHLDSEILSGAFWDLRTSIGAETADQLIHLARFLEPQTFEEYLVAILVVDDNNPDGNENFYDGTLNSDSILEAFNNHGIGPGELEAVFYNSFVHDGDFQGTIGDNDEFIDRGETVDLVVELRSWYYRDISNAQINLELDDSNLASWINIVEDSSHIGDIITGSIVSNQDSPFRLEISDELPENIDSVTFRININGQESGGDQYSYSDTFDLIVPKVVIVDSSGGGDFTSVVDGISAANPGDTVLVKQGEYYENPDHPYFGNSIVITKKGLKIRGEDKRNTYVKDLCFLIFHTSDVEISNLNIEIPGGKPSIVENSQNIVLKNNLLSNCGEGFLFNYNNHGCVMEGNYVYDCSINGLTNENVGSHNVLEGNYIWGVKGHGIFLLDSVEDTIVQYNSISHSRGEYYEGGTGILISLNHAPEPTKTIVRGNFIENSTYGIISFWSDHVLIFENSLYDDNNANQYLGYDVAWDYEDLQVGNFYIDNNPYSEVYDIHDFSSNLMNQDNFALETPITYQVLFFNEGWNTFSFNIIPEESDITTLFQPLVDSGELEILKNSKGGVYIPGTVNSLGEVNINDVYSVHVTQDTKLLVKGGLLDPHQPLILNQGWNPLPYYPRYGMMASEAFSEILDKVGVVVELDTENIELHEYNPEDPETDFIMLPGYGYKIYLTEDVEYSFPLECEDLMHGQCADEAPDYCKNGQIIDYCQECGCPSNRCCMASGICGKCGSGSSSPIFRKPPTVMQ